MKILIELSLPELKHLISSLKIVKDNGEHCGNKKQFLKRHNKLIKMLTEDKTLYENM